MIVVVEQKSFLQISVGKGSIYGSKRRVEEIAYGPTFLW